MNNELILYKSDDGRTEVQLRTEDGSLWLTQLEMAAYPIAKPSSDVAAHFTELVTGFNAKEMLNVESAGKLVKLRDTLLPKLISGELRVEDC